jgi:hypothetical protein
MEKGQIISGIAHAGVILWVVLGDWLFRADTLPEIEVAEVSLMSSAEFDAMMASAPKPAAPTTVPEEPAATPEVTPPEPVQPEAPPPQPEDAPPPQPEEPLPEDLPQEAVPQPIETPDPVAPIAEVEQPIPVPLSDAKPRPRPVDRVAATPVESEDAPEVADQVIEEVTDQPTEETTIVEQEQEAAAPEEATTQIVTEAVETEEDAPQLEMTSSLRPRSRPLAQPEEAPPEEEEVAAADTTEDPTEEPAEEPAETPVEDPATEDAVAAALAEALAEETVAEETADTGAAEQNLPVGPPMTAGEKDALRVAVNACWNVGALSMEALRTTITVGFSVGQDGVPDAGSIALVDSNGESDTATRQAYEAARRAIIRCGARGFPLPAEKFEQWKNIEIVFDPNGMRMR